MDAAKNIINILLDTAGCTSGYRHDRHPAFEARDVASVGRQWFWLVVITALVAGLCIWDQSWGDGDDESGRMCLVRSSVHSRNHCTRRAML